MRKCSVCALELPIEAFSSGSNWSWCKACKGNSVQTRKWLRDGNDPAVVEAWRDAGKGQRFTDFIQPFRSRAAFLRRASMPARTLSPKTRYPPRFRKDWRERWASSYFFTAWYADNPQEVQELEATRLAEEAVAAELRSREQREAEELRDARKVKQKIRDNYLAREKRRSDPEGQRRKERAKRAANPMLYKSFDAASRVRNAGYARPSAVLLSLVWEAHAGDCNICGEPCDPNWWHADHVVALSRGGKHDFSNLAPAHPYCNMVKGAKTNDMLDVNWLRVTRPTWEAEVGARMRAGQSAPCGTVQRYWKGCRCRPCKDARAAYGRQRRAAAGKPGRPGPSGTKE